MRNHFLVILMVLLLSMSILFGTAATSRGEATSGDHPTPQVSTSPNGSGYVIMPYLYPVYPGYQNDLENHTSIISGLQYEDYAINTTGALIHCGSGGVTQSLKQAGIPAWPMIVNLCNVTAVKNLVHNKSGSEEVFIQNAVADAVDNNYSGYSVDFEPPSSGNFNLSDGACYITFLNKFQAAMEAVGKGVSVAIYPAYQGCVSSDLYYYFYHPVARINVSYVMPMDYSASFSGSCGFKSSVDSMLNATGTYIPESHVEILIITTNCNDNLPMTQNQLSERISYIQSEGITAMGVWSMNMTGGFYPSQNLWNLMGDFHNGSEMSKYQVEAFSSGLPTGSQWCINVTGLGSYAASGGPVCIQLPDGTYQYTVSSANKDYVPSSYSGNFRVNNSSLNITLIFHVLSFTVSLMESGLSGGSGWTVSLAGATYQPSASGEVQTSLSNGTYHYCAIPVNRDYKRTCGSFTVKGGFTEVTVHFYPVTYRVEVVLPDPGNITKWYIDLNGSSNMSSVSNSIVLNLMNGTYHATVGTLTPYYSNQNITITVNGSNLLINVTFSGSCARQHQQTIFSILYEYSMLPLAILFSIIAVFFFKTRKKRSPGR